MSHQSGASVDANIATSQNDVVVDTKLDKEGRAPNAGGQQPIFVIVMGVSGTGKSTLGSALAKELGMPYIEGDDLHPQSNIKKMSSGVPLNDQDREPWLELIRKRAEELAFEDRSDVDTASEKDKDKVQGVVAGCSALKKYYREILRGRLKPATTKSDAVPEYDYHIAPPSPATLPTYFVFVDGPKEVLYDRMSKRPGHFFKASMLDSQLATLEDPTGEEGVVVVSLESTTEEQISLAKLVLGKLVGRDL